MGKSIGIWQTKCPRVVVGNRLPVIPESRSDLHRDLYLQHHRLEEDEPQGYRR